MFSCVFLMVCFSGCGLNYHKRCTYKIPNNCSLSKRKRNSITSQSSSSNDSSVSASIYLPTCMYLPTYLCIPTYLSAYLGLIVYIHVYAPDVNIYVLSIVVYSSSVVVGVGGGGHVWTSFPFEMYKGAASPF